VQFKERILPYVFGYITVVLLDLMCIAVEYLDSCRYITKPLILCFLITFFLQNRTGLPKAIVCFMLLALVFSLLGDILLLFDKTHNLFFIGGLTSFLIAHVFYVLVFLKKRNKKKKSGVFLLITIVYGAILLYIIQPNLNELLIPVVLYMIVILSMSNTAYLREGKVNLHSYWYVFIGSLFFMFSDSFLAFNIFYKPVYMGGVVIMGTYAIAQFLLVYGMIREMNID